MDEMIEMLDVCGYSPMYNFVYIPMDFKSGDLDGDGTDLLNLQHAIVNFTSEDVAEVFMTTYQGSPESIFEEAGEVAYHKEQGLDFLVNKYRNSGVMHESMPASCRPLLFKNGDLVEFPPPTRKLKAPPAKKRKLNHAE